MAGATLSASIASKTGTDSNRDWKLQVTNSGGSIATGAQISNFRINQTGGKSCQVVVGPTPVSLGDLAAGQSAYGDVYLGFIGCDSSAKFSITAGLSANNGATTATMTRNNERK
jgi:hypothetical protein